MRRMSRTSRRRNGRLKYASPLKKLILKELGTAQKVTSSGALENATSEGLP